MTIESKFPSPVIVLTGFLGSGKTTLLNRLLAQGSHAAVLINEFGCTPVDQRLIERKGMPLMTLSGGCRCRQVRGTVADIAFIARSPKSTPCSQTLRWC